MRRYGAGGRAWYPQRHPFEKASEAKKNGNMWRLHCWPRKECRAAGKPAVRYAFKVVTILLLSRSVNWNLIKSRSASLLVAIVL